MRKEEREGEMANGEEVEGGLRENKKDERGRGDGIVLVNTEGLRWWEGDILPEKMSEDIA
jgi:hypothetical protein